MREIDGQDGDRNSADRRASDQQRPIPPKVMSPFVAVGMKETYDPVRLFINSAQIRSAMMIACETGKSEVRSDRGASMLPWNNMIDFELQLIKLLGHLAVFAAVPCTLPNELKQKGVHEWARRFVCCVAGLGEPWTSISTGLSRLVRIRSFPGLRSLSACHLEP